MNNKKLRISDTVWYWEDNILKWGTVHNIAKTHYFYNSTNEDESYNVEITERLPNNGRKISLYRSNFLYGYPINLANFNRLIMKNCNDNKYILKDIYSDFFIDKLDGFLCDKKDYIILSDDILMSNLNNTPALFKGCHKIKPHTYIFKNITLLALSYMYSMAIDRDLYFRILYNLRDFLWLDISDIADSKFSAMLKDELVKIKADSLKLVY